MPFTKVHSCALPSEKDFFVVENLSQIRVFSSLSVERM